MESSYILKDSLIPLINYVTENKFNLDILVPGSYTLMHIDLDQKALELTVDNLSEYNLRLLSSLDSVYRSKKLRLAIADMLMLSGCLPPQGIDKLLDILLEKDTSDLRELALCLDTNILFNRIFSQYVFPKILKVERNLNILISRQVEAEIGSNLLSEVRRVGNLPRTLEILKEPEIKTFLKVYGVGAPSLEARRAAIAIHELGLLEQQKKLIKIYRSSESATSRLEPDFLIVSSCKKLAEENSFKLLVLTMDDHTYTCAQILKCNALKLIPQANFPYRIEGVSLTNISELIYVVTMILGFIRLRVGPEVLEIIGSWRGKSLKEWRLGRLLLRYPKFGILSKYIRKVLKADSVLTALKVIDQYVGSN